MAFVDVDQKDVDWLKMRIGCASASNQWKMHDFLKPKKGETQPQESAKRYAYKMEKVIEELTGRSQESYVTPAMEWGIDTEPLARAAYEIANDVEVLNGGIFFHEEIRRYCASPDGRIGEDGLLEIKCPTTGTHLEIVMSGEIPEEYKLQMDAQLSCSGRQFVDFVSYDNRIHARHLQLWQKRYPRDPARIKAAEDAVCTFLLEVIALINSLEDKPCLATTTD